MPKTLRRAGAGIALSGLLTLGFFAVAADEPALKVKGAAPKAGPSDHASFGGTLSRNMVNPIDKNVPDTFEAADEKVLKWKAELGSRAYGGPIIAGGKVFVGTNNERPRNKRDEKKDPDGGAPEPIDKGILMCFEEATGKFLWQTVHDKLPSGQVNDWPKEGVCSTPVVEGERIYYTSNRCTLVCLDVNGMAGGGQPLPTQKYKDKTDARFVWELDMMKDLGVFPHNMTAASPLLLGDILFVVTANGVDENHINIPAPQAPSFIAVDKNTGKVLWKSNLPGRNIMHGQWANPSFADVNGVKQVIFPGGDGWIYSFVPETGELVWKFDSNPKSAVYDLGGAGNKSDYIGTPVIYENKLYIGTGQDPEHFTGVAYFHCIDIEKALANAKKNKDKDVSWEVVDKTEKNEEGKVVVKGKPNPDTASHWVYGGDDKRDFVPRNFSFGRTMSSACIVDGIVYISELSGYLHCLDAKTGKKYWQYDCKGGFWGSPYFVDGKVYLGTEGGALFVFKHTKTPPSIDEIDNPTAKTQKEFNAAMKAKKAELEKQILISKVEFDTAIRSTPVVANGVLYVMTENDLYAFTNKK